MSDWEGQDEIWESLAGKTIASAQGFYANWQEATIRFTDGTMLHIEADGDVVVDWVSPSPDQGLAMCEACCEPEAHCQCGEAPK